MSVAKVLGVVYFIVLIFGDGGGLFKSDVCLFLNLDFFYYMRWVFCIPFCHRCDFKI